MFSRLLPLAFVMAVAGAVVLAGCGGGSPNQNANEVYASGVCTAIGSWLAEVKGVDTLPPLGGITKASIAAKLKHFDTNTRQFVSHIKALPAPNTSEGRAAKSKIDQSPLISGAQGEIASARAVASILANGSMTQVIGSLAALPDFQTLKTTAQSTRTYLEMGGGSLASTFKSEPACKQLG